MVRITIANAQSILKKYGFSLQIHVDNRCSTEHTEANDMKEALDYILKI